MLLLLRAVLSMLVRNGNLSEYNDISFIYCVALLMDMIVLCCCMLDSVCKLCFETIRNMFWVWLLLIIIIIIYFD